MCEPISIITGAVSAVGGVMQAQAQHQAAQAAAARQNQINELNYQNKLNIAAHKDKLAGQKFKRELEANAAAHSALMRQRQLNQMEATRASVAAQQALKEKGTEIAFKGQEALTKKIQAQGQILASGQQSGQSLLLSLMDTERQLGFEEAQLNASMQDANVAYGIQQYGINLDKYTADVNALNRLPAKPAAPSASFAPVKMPEVKGPSGLGLMGGIISSVAGGVGSGFDVYSETKNW